MQRLDTYSLTRVQFSILISHMNFQNFNAMLMVILDLYNLITACDFSLVLLFYVADGLSSQSCNLEIKKLISKFLVRKKLLMHKF